MTNHQTTRLDPAHPVDGESSPVILSFDVEEHFRIEAAAGLDIDSGLESHYARRLEASLHWLLEELARRSIQATFFIVGVIARTNPGLVKEISACGHEVASHGWEHRRIHHLGPAAFRQDVRKSKEVLEQVSGQPILGFRAPTFSIVADTAWALDILVEEGFGYDSSIFPVWHDRYGVPGAPRKPFLARGKKHSIVELPPATWRILGHNVPMGGGGYFRLFPLFLLSKAVRQCSGRMPGAMLYFHPWEFDPSQARLPLGRVGGFRTYVGIGASRRKLSRLLDRHRFVCAQAAVNDLLREGRLEEFAIHRGGNGRPAKNREAQAVQ